MIIHEKKLYGFQNPVCNHVKRNFTASNVHVAHPSRKLLFHQDSQTKISHKETLIIRPCAVVLTRYDWKIKKKHKTDSNISNDQPTDEGTKNMPTEVDGTGSSGFCSRNVCDKCGIVFERLNENCSKTTTTCYLCEIKSFSSIEIKEPKKEPIPVDSTSGVSFTIGQIRNNEDDVEISDLGNLGEYLQVRVKTELEETVVFQTNLDCSSSRLLVSSNDKPVSMGFEDTAYKCSPKVEEEYEACTVKNLQTMEPFPIVKENLKIETSEVIYEAENDSQSRINTELDVLESPPVDHNEEGSFSDPGSYSEQSSEEEHCDDPCKSGQFNYRPGRNVDTLPKRFNCRECHIVFTFAQTLACHEWIVHGIPHPPNGCKYCKISLAESPTTKGQKSDSADVELLNSKESTKCKICGQSFSSTTLLKEHSVVHLNRIDADESILSVPVTQPSLNYEEVKLLKCEKCKELFENLNEIKEHDCAGYLIPPEEGHKDRSQTTTNVSEKFDNRKRKSSEVSERTIKRCSKNRVQKSSEEGISILYDSTRKSSTGSSFNENSNTNIQCNGLSSQPSFIKPEYVSTDKSCDSLHTAEPVCQISSCVSLVGVQEDWSLTNDAEALESETQPPISSLPKINPVSCLSHQPNMMYAKMCRLCGVVCNGNDECLKHMENFHPERTKFAVSRAALSHPELCAHLKKSLEPIVKPTYSQYRECTSYRKPSYSCLVCGESFEAASALSHHEVTIHMTQELKEAGYEILILPS